MDVPQSVYLLKKIYHIHEVLVSNEQTFCGRGCSTCCTCNVTATTLESLLIYDHLISEKRVEWLENIVASAPSARFQPLITINQMAGLCAQGKDIPDEACDPFAGICPFLANDVCTIYPIRPFGCRAMLSSIDCRLGGEAQMPAFMLTVNNVIMQHLEAVDQYGGTGNLFNVLRFILIDAFREIYFNGQGVDADHGLLANQPLPVLMVPPEHRSSIHPLLQSINRVIQQSQ